MPSKDGKPIPADLPAGHKRDELNRQITDNLAQQQEEEEKIFGGAIDPSKMGKFDNEIAGPMLEQHRRRRSGMPPLSNPRPGFVYGWFPNEDFFRTSEARVVVRTIIDRARQEGYFPVTDDHDAKVAEEFKSDGTLRRWGDTILYAINKADWMLLQQENARRQSRLGAVEENYVNMNSAAIRGRGSVYNHNDERFARKMGVEKTRPITVDVVNEGDRR